MKEENRLFEALLDVIPFAAYAVDIQTYEVVYANKLMSETMFAPRESFCWKKVYGQESACTWCTIPQLEKRKKLYSNDKLLTDFFDEGSDKWFQSYDELVRWPDGRTVKYSIFVDITEQKEIQASMISTNTKLAIQTKKLQEANKKLEELSKTDFLTKIHNRAYFFQEAKKFFSKRLEFNKNIYAMMLDIDDFKKINDTFGHNIGDEALKAFTKAVQSCLQEDEIFGRLGGEEFAILLESKDDAAVKKKAKDIQDALQKMQLFCDADKVEVKVSIGIALKTEDDSIDSLLDRADKQLYKAKKSGKNRVIFRV